MPKMRTRKSAAKRFKVTKTGKHQHRRTGMSHFLTKKSAARKRRGRQAIAATPAAAKQLRRQMPYGGR